MLETRVLASLPRCRRGAVDCARRRRLPRRGCTWVSPRHHARVDAEPARREQRAVEGRRRTERRASGWEEGEGGREGQGTDGECAGPLRSAPLRSALLRSAPVAPAGPALRHRPRPARVRGSGREEGGSCTAIRRRAARGGRVCEDDEGGPRDASARPSAPAHPGPSRSRSRPDRAARSYSSSRPALLMPRRNSLLFSVFSMRSTRSWRASRGWTLLRTRRRT